MSVLYAFYDLAVSPPTFDYFCFMELAELARRRRNCAQVHVVFVPGPKNGFRDDNLPPDLTSRQAFMRNLVIPSTFLLPHLAGLSWLESRIDVLPLFERAAGNVFPEGYTPQRPVADYVWRAVMAATLRGERTRTLTAPPERLAQAERYVETVAKGRKVVTMTLRECGYHSTRNSDIAAWSRFSNWLDKTKYCPIIIRDTRFIYEALPDVDAVSCDQAAIDILFRTALYQRSHLNMFIANGCQYAAILTNSPTLIVKLINNDCVSTTATHLANVEAVAAEYPIANWARTQEAVWKDDTFETLRDAFLALSARLDEGGDDLAGEQGFVHPDQLRVASDILTRVALNRSAQGMSLLDADTVIAAAECDPGNTLAVLIGAIQVAARNDHGRALRMLNTAIVLSPDETRLINSRAIILEGIGNLADALADYRQIQAQAPSPATEAKIADLDRAIGQALLTTG